MTVPADVLNEIRSSGATKVKVAVTDIDGVLRGKYMHIDKFLSSVDSGFGFCSVVLGWDCSDVCYDNVKYTGWHTGYPDTKAVLDLSTYRTVPWDNNVPFFLGDFVDEKDQPLPVCPRQLLRKVIKEAAEAGFEAMIGIEFEWFNFRETPQSLHDKGFVGLEPLTPGMFGYSLLRSGMEGDFFNDIFDLLREFNIPIEGLHTETGPGVYEAAIMAGQALETADRAVLFKSSVKELAAKYGYTASFMARWNPTLPGCSGHIHQSMKDRNGTNIFFDAADPLKMSPVFKNYLAGQIKYLPEILPMFAPTVNSYKRLVDGYWAPTRANWGSDNRTTCFRVIPGSIKSTRLETRLGGADINPYLAVAASMAAGLMGIKEKLPLTAEKVTGNGYQSSEGVRFSTNLSEAAELFYLSQNARSMFGDAFVDHFANSRRWEWREYQKAVTDWELRRYFEII